MAGVVIGVDASRNRSGGAKVHLIGILKDSDPREFGIEQVHVWSYRSLLDALPDRPWLVKHNPAPLESSLPAQLLWQARDLPREARRLACTVLLNTDAGSICTFRPAVVMSRDMLSFEPGEIERFGWTRARLRLIALRYVQAMSLRRAAGTVFLTEYAAKIIQQQIGRVEHMRVIPHGVAEEFKTVRRSRAWPADSSTPIECLYVSNAAMYKHPWMVVQAVAELRRMSVNIRLTLAGGGAGRAQQLLERQLRQSDPRGEFVSCAGFIRPQDLPTLLAGADLFVFASSCENMPNTLVEAMAVGLPIACSARGPMPEVLQDGGVFFDPERPPSIAAAIKKLVDSSDLRERCSIRARELASQYSWKRCGRETWEFLITTLNRYQQCL